MSARQPLAPIVPLDVALHRVVCSAGRLLLAVQESGVSMAATSADALADLALAMYDRQQAAGRADVRKSTAPRPSVGHGRSEATIPIVVRLSGRSMTCRSVWWD